MYIIYATEPFKLSHFEYFNIFVNLNAQFLQMFNPTYLLVSLIKFSFFVREIYSWPLCTSELKVNLKQKTRKSGKVASDMTQRRIYRRSC